MPFEFGDDPREARLKAAEEAVKALRKEVRDLRETVSELSLAVSSVRMRTEPIGPRPGDLPRISIRVPDFDYGKFQDEMTERMDETLRRRRMGKNLEGMGCHFPRGGET